MTQPNDTTYPQAVIDAGAKAFERIYDDDTPAGEIATAIYEAMSAAVGKQGGATRPEEQQVK